MKYCCQCGQEVERRIPDDDDRLRYICAGCDTVHYQNPKMVVGTLPIYGEQVLLCRRAIEPRKGFWTLPAGFMENSETTVAGALRESWEEARANIATPVLYRMFDLPFISQVYIFYRGELVKGEFGVGPESLEVKLFDEKDIPWDDIAFPVVVETLREYFQDRKTDHYPVRVTEIDPFWRQNQ